MNSLEKINILLENKKNEPLEIIISKLKVVLKERGLDKKIKTFLNKQIKLLEKNIKSQKKTIISKTSKIPKIPKLKNIKDFSQTIIIEQPSKKQVTKRPQSFSIPLQLKQQLDLKNKLNIDRERETNLADKLLKKQNEDTQNKKVLEFLEQEEKVKADLLKKEKDERRNEKTIIRTDDFLRSESLNKEREQQFRNFTDLLENNQKLIRNIPRQLQVELDEKTRVILNRQLNDLSNFTLQQNEKFDYINSKLEPLERISDIIISKEEVIRQSKIKKLENKLLKEANKLEKENLKNKKLREAEIAKQEEAFKKQEEDIKKMQDTRKQQEALTEALRSPPEE